MVWTLAFDEESKTKLIEEGIIDFLESFKNVQGDTKKAIDGALWTLTKKEDSTALVPIATKGNHVMISYSWAQKDRMRELAYFIRDQGFPIWIDVEKLDGSVLEKVSEAIEDASVVIIGLSSAYKESQSCRTEAEYAYSLRKEVIYIRVEEGFSSRGWLGAMVGNNLIYHPWKDPNNFQASSGDIIKRLARITGAHASKNTSEPKTENPKSKHSFKSVGNAIVSGNALKDYSETKIPESREPLPKELLSPSKVESWGIEEVCRWLHMVGLVELQAAFVWHGIKGSSLISLESLSKQTFSEIWEDFEIDKLRLELGFQNELRALLRPETVQEAKKWKTDRVVSHLLEKNLSKIAEVAQSRGWDGKVLFAVFSSIGNRQMFDTFCSEYKIKSVSDQLRFISVLTELFAP